MTETEFVYGNEEYYEGRPSKSQRKRDMLALQELGEHLVELSLEQVERMNLPPDLAEAVRFWHSLRDKEAKRRHLQYIGTLMRKLDPEPVRQALEELDQLRFQQAAEFHQLEEWRDALVAGDNDVLEEVVTQLGLDRQQVRQLARNAALEKAKGKPSKNGRQLFRMLRQAAESQQAEPAGLEDED